MMDDFGLYPREEPFDPLGVMLFKALVLWLGGGALYLWS